jgi:hypothetical protein
LGPAFLPSRIDRAAHWVQTTTGGILSVAIFDGCKQFISNNLWALRVGVTKRFEEFVLEPTTDPRTIPFQ